MDIAGLEPATSVVGSAILPVRTKCPNNVLKYIALRNVASYVTTEILATFFSSEKNAQFFSSEKFSLLLYRRFR